MRPPRIHIHPNPNPNPKRMLRRPLISRERNCERAAADQVGGEAVVGVWCIVSVTADIGELDLHGTRELVKGRGVRAISPSEDCREAPGADLGFGIFAGGGHHGRR